MELWFFGQSSTRLCLTDSLSSLEVVGTCYLDVELPDKSGLNVTFQSVHVSNFLQAICLT